MCIGVPTWQCFVTPTTCERTSKNKARFKGGSHPFLEPVCLDFWSRFFCFDSIKEMRFFKMVDLKMDFNEVPLFIVLSPVRWYLDLVLFSSRGIVRRPYLPRGSSHWPYVSSRTVSVPRGKPVSLLLRKADFSLEPWSGSLHDPYRLACVTVSRCCPSKHHFSRLTSLVN